MIENGHACVYVRIYAVFMYVFKHACTACMHTCTHTTHISTLTHGYAIHRTMQARAHVAGQGQGPGQRERQNQTQGQGQGQGQRQR